MRRQKSSKGQVKLSRQEQDAAKRREQMAAAAEARIARLQLVSEQQQLWCYMAPCVLPQSFTTPPCDSVAKEHMQAVSTASRSMASELSWTDVDVEHSLTLQVIPRGSQERHGDGKGPKPFWSRSQIFAGCIAAAVFWMHTRNST